MYPPSFNMFLGSAFFLIWVVIHIPFSRACLKAERNYLLDVKAGLNISSGRFSSWRGFNCCEWEGVACDHHTSHVIRLYLSYKEILESQPLSELRPSLFDLQHLQHLDLSGNDFQGISIPPHFSKLQRLTFLSLSDARFRGEVPLELGNMSSLRHLDISSYFLISRRFDVWVRKLRSLEFLGMSRVNLSMVSDNSWGEALSGLANLTYVDQSHSQLSGKIPDLSNLTHLSHLDLAENSFPFELPSWFENASSLVSLNLYSCYLKGSIPYNFMARSRLKYLDLSYNNDLKGNPSFMLSHSSSLVVLSISDCNLGGTLGLSMKNLSKLEVMDLSYNNLVGSIPTSIGSLSSLRNLELRHNQLSGTIPDSISNMVSLEILLLSSNRLTGNFLLQRLENMSRLETLGLSENQLVVNISTTWVPQFSILHFLGLRSCNIEGDVPRFLSQQYQLVDLDLSDNNMAGNIPSWLWDLPILVRLNLSNNQLEGFLPHKMSQAGFEAVDLHGNRLYGPLPANGFLALVLDLSDNEFNGSIPIPFGTSTSLSLSGNNLTGKIPSSICDLSSKILDLSRNKLIGDIPANIGRCSSLLVLKLAQNCLEGEIPKELGNMLQGLITLNVNGNMLQGIIPPSLANCTQLQVFDLGNNKFEGSIPVWIENLKDLRILSLASNKFRIQIPPQLFIMPSLQILDLPDNQLSGNIPSDVSKLYAMINISQSFDVQSIERPCAYIDCVFKFADEVTVWIKGRETPYEKIIGADKFIDMSRNNLSGNIPPELGLLKGLISLNISKNNLTGPIPDSLGAVGYLESLDLSENKLSGKIPSQLLNLTFLAVLNLSDNMLVGLIPQGKQFSTFESSSFLGNPNLHGPPLRK